MGGTPCFPGQLLEKAGWPQMLGWKSHDLLFLRETQGRFVLIPEMSPWSPHGAPQAVPAGVCPALNRTCSGDRRSLIKVSGARCLR